MCQNILCISHSELVEGGIINYSNLHYYVGKGRVKQLQLGGNGREALFAVDSLPLKYRTEIYKRYPDVQEQKESKPFMDNIEPDGAAINFYDSLRFDDGTALKPEKRQEYANNCAILNAFGRVMEECIAIRMRTEGKRLKKGDFWRKCASALPRLADKFPHSLPGNGRRLMEKYEEYKRNGYEVMISGKHGNDNGGKVATEEQKAMLLSLISFHNNLDCAWVARAYNAVAAVNGWKPISDNTVGRWKQKFDLETSIGRLGQTKFRAKRTMQVKRSRPTAPFLMWTLDGWVVELLYQKTTVNKKGHHVTTYDHRLTLVVVLDPCCDYPIGYAIGEHENPALIKEALRNALTHGKELTGEMLRANQIQSDRYDIKGMRPTYAVVGDKVTPTRAKNAKGKVIEPYFNHLNNTYCKVWNNWGGYGITSRPDRQPNNEALNKLKKEFPTEPELRAMIHQMMAFERSVKHEQFMDMLAKLPADRRLPMDRQQYLLHFGADTGYKNAIEGPGLRPRILGVKRDYDCFDINFRKHSHERWTVKYDPDDLHEILAVNDDGTLQFMLEEKYVQPMAVADRKEGDAEQLARVDRFNEDLEDYVYGFQREVKETAQRVIEDVHEYKEIEGPINGGILNRIVLTDSLGQHKKQRDARRMGCEVDDLDEPCMETVPVSESKSDGLSYDIF